MARAVAEADVEPETDAPPEPARADFDEDAPTRIHDGGALSAAFSFAAGRARPRRGFAGGAGRMVRRHRWFADWSLTLPQLKEKAATRKATLDSLV